MSDPDVIRTPPCRPPHSRMVPLAIWSLRTSSSRGHGFLLQQQVGLTNLRPRDYSNVYHRTHGTVTGSGTEHASQTKHQNYVIY
jgi:hypothetical protein